MILFEVTGKKYEDSIIIEKEFITAKKSSDAIKKFVELHCDCRYLKSIKICDRDKIIPTVEPIKEKI